MGSDSANFQVTIPTGRGIVIRVLAALAAIALGTSLAPTGAAAASPPPAHAAARADSAQKEAAMQTRVRRPGEFCWINMLTPQPGKAREFFAALLGWTYVEMPGIGHGVRVGGHDIGGLFDLEGPRTPPGTPPEIGVMVKVESADSAGARAAALGGRSLPAFDIGPQGRMAVCFDPGGANLDVWQAKDMPGTEVDPAAHGAPSWFECRTADVERAAAFYAAWFGWTAQASPKLEPGYVTFLLDSTYVAGLGTPRDSAKAAPAWVTYFTVADAAAAAKQAAALGATIREPVREVPGVGRACGITSPQGVPFCVIEYRR